MAESSFASAGPEVQSWDSIGLVSGEDGKLSVPSELKADPIGPRVRTLLTLLDLAVAAHNARVDEIAELKGQRKTADAVAAGEKDFQVTRRLSPLGVGSDSDIPSTGPSAWL